MEIVGAAAEDVDGIRAIAGAYGNLDGWPGRPDWLDFQLEAGALTVARDGRAVVGFAGVVAEGGVAHLADLFVAPGRLGEGIGGRLLEAALPAGVPRATYASADPRALPLYVRFGMRPLTPLLYLRGEPARAGAACAAGPAPLGDLPATRGRPGVLDFLHRAGAYALRSGDAYAVVRPLRSGARIGPAAASADELVALTAAAARAHGAVELAVLGPHPALPQLLERGLRIVATDTYMASAPDLLDPMHYVPEQDLG